MCGHQKGCPKCEAGPKLIGYARCSTDDQTTALQRDALYAAGCEVVFEDSASGMKRDRPQLAQAVAALAPGDTLVVWKLDRLGRSLPHLVELADHLRDRGVHLRSLTEALDTATASGRLLYAVLGAVAAFERDVIVERTRAGVQRLAARRRWPKAVICRVLGVARSTAYYREHDRVPIVDEILAQRIKHLIDAVK